MTKHQRISILCGTLLIVLMGLFPPWMAVERTTHPQCRFSGYHFVTYLGGKGAIGGINPGGFADKYLQSEGLSSYSGSYNYEIYTSVLLIQWFCVFLVTVVAYIMCGNWKIRRHDI